MSDGAWTQIAQMVLGVVGLIALWLKIRSAKQSVETKIDAKSEAIQTSVDANTMLTQEGTASATLHAKEAADTAKQAKDTAKEAATAAQAVSKKLNGGLDHAIAAALKPLKEEMAAFVTNEKFSELEKYVHERNHDLLDAMQVLSHKVTLVLKNQEEK